VCAGHPRRVQPERVVLFRPKTVLQVAGVLLGVAISLWVVWIARQTITWVLVALFLALALNPAVSLLQLRGVRHRASAAAIIYVLALLVVGLLAALLVPPLVDQVRGLASAAPGYVQDLTAGRGPLGFLERNYQIVEKVQQATRGKGGGAASLLGGAGTVLSLTKAFVTGVVGFVTIAFLTFFMLIEGPTWSERIIGLSRPDSRPRWRWVGQQISHTVSGYVTGNLLISVVAGASSALVLFIAGVPFALALGLVVAVLDLVPLAGATIAGIILLIVAFLTSVQAGIIVGVFFLLYQQVENHVLQPLVYGRTVQLSPLVVLVAILIGSEVAGVLGALGAIPIAGSLQILLLDWLRHRRELRNPEHAPRATAVAAETVQAAG
jgi:predicted PurR-regulated permease PerM